jgi:hypothetical protein
MGIFKGILIGIVLWLLIFVEVSVLMFAFNLSSDLYYIIHFILLSLFVILGCLWYFRKSKGGFLRGLLVGIIFVITGIILDAIITAPFFASEGYVLLIRTDILLGELWIIILSALVGLAMKR